MKTNYIVKLFVVAFLFMAGVAFAAAADKKPVGVSAKEYAVTTTVKDKKVIVTAVGKAGYHCNTLYPWKITVGEKVYTKKDASKFAEDGVVFKFDPAGVHKGTLKLSICNDAQCLMETAELTW